MVDYQPNQIQYCKAQDKKLITSGKAILILLTSYNTQTNLTIFTKW